MTAKRKRVTMLVTVSVPANVSAAMARKEVRSLVTYAANWSLDPGDVKAISVTPGSRWIIDGA